MRRLWRLKTADYFARNSASRRLLPYYLTGALLVLTPPVAITSLIVSAAFYLISRKAVASGVATFALMPAFAIMFGSSTSDLIAVTAITVLLLATHRSSLAEIAGVFRRGKSVTGESTR